MSDPLTLLSAIAGEALAGAGPGPMHTLWFGDPLVEAAMALLLLMWFRGLQRLQSRHASSAVADAPHIAAFGAAMLVTAIVALSPLDALGARLFSAHMLQHLLLIVLAAPLLAWSEADRMLVAAVDPRFATAPAVRAVALWSGTPEAAWAAAVGFSVTIWFWHVPAAHDWAIDNPLVHGFEHLMVLGTATLFWRVVLTSGRRRVGPATAAVMVSLVGLQGALLSALIMFAPNTLCRSYAGNPLDDQVLAGLLMCIPASFVYVGSTVWALSRMLGNGQDHVR